MNRNVLLTDLGITALAVILVIVITPGLAIAGLIALLVLLAFLVGAVRSARRRGQARTPRANRAGVRTRTRTH